jgi:hypothetical protein
MNIPAMTCEPFVWARSASRCREAAWFDSPTALCRHKQIRLLPLEILCKMAHFRKPAAQGKYRASLRDGALILWTPLASTSEDNEERHRYRGKQPDS